MIVQKLFLALQTLFYKRTTNFYGATKTEKDMRQKNYETDVCERFEESSQKKNDKTWLGKKSVLVFLYSNRVITDQSTK